ncbi:MAG TPA: hypothetical protein VNU25_00745 [Candidatus Paceibacterota bacterium]|nr:hypothetical protein [Candidatus Paceibacterota bacterium]
MKQLLAGVVILFVVGFGSFLYRNIMERPSVTVPEVACTMEAKLCPDGSSVGRTGPRCEFVPCAFPNIELSGIGIGFAAPAGYTQDTTTYASDRSVLYALTKPSLAGNPKHAILVRRYPIPEGEAAETVMLAATRFQPADEQATETSRFANLAIGSLTFQEVTIERFEALVYTRYYLVREKDVVAFDIIEHDVTGWMEPSLSVRSLPEHGALLSALRTLQAAP